MKRLISFLALTCFAILPAAVQQDPRFSTRTEILAKGNVKFTITNQSPKPITAMIIIFHRPTTKGLPQPDSIRVYDAVLQNPIQREILPGESRDVPMGGDPNESTPLTELRAVLFDDGTSFGDAQWVDRIVQTRKLAWQNLNDAISTMRDAKRTGADLGELITDFQGRQKQLALENMNEIIKQDGSPSGSGAGFVPVVYATAAGALRARSDHSGNDPSTDQKIDIAIGQLLDMRQRLYYSRPQVAAPDEAIDPPIPPLNYFQFNFPDSKSGGIVFAELLQNLPGKGLLPITAVNGAAAYGAREYRVETTFQGKPVQALRAAMYVPGCKIVTVDVPSLAGSMGSADFHCDPLPMLKLNGRVESSDLLAGKPYKVDVRLIGKWTDRDIMFFSFPLGTITPDSDGTFSIEFTDFSADPIVSQAGQAGLAIAFAAWSSDKKSHNRILADFQPLQDSDDRFRGWPALSILPNYGGEVRFTVVPIH